MKTVDNETKTKKAKYDAYRERQIEYEKHRVRSFQQPWGNEFQWVRHTMTTDTNGSDKKYCIVKCVCFFGPLDLGSGPPEL